MVLAEGADEDVDEVVAHLCDLCLLVRGGCFSGYDFGGPVAVAAAVGAPDAGEAGGLEEGLGVDGAAAAGGFEDAAELADDLVDFGGWDEVEHVAVEKAVEGIIGEGEEAGVGEHEGEGGCAGGGEAFAGEGEHAWGEVDADDAFGAGLLDLLDDAVAGADGDFEVGLAGFAGHGVEGDAFGLGLEFDGGAVVDRCGGAVEGLDFALAKGVIEQCV